LNARRRHSYGPLSLGLLAACVIALGKFYFNSSFTAGVGMILLLGASLWNMPNSRKADSGMGCNC